MLAFLWTPEDLIRLDAAPFLRRELRRVAFAATVAPARRAAWAAQTARTQTLIHLLAAIIEEIRALPAHDVAVAQAFLARRRLLRRQMGRAPFGWIQDRAADWASYRLLPHPIMASPECPVVLREFVVRAAALRAQGRLVMCGPSHHVPSLQSDLLEGP